MVKKMRNLVYHAHLLETPNIHWYMKEWKVQQLTKLFSSPDSNLFHTGTFGGSILYSHPIEIVFWWNPLWKFNIIQIYNYTQGSWSFKWLLLFYFHPFHFHYSKILLSFFTHVPPLLHRYVLLYFYPKWLNKLSSLFNKEK